MISRKPIFQKPVDDVLYPVRNKNGEIETLVNPNTDTALTTDADSKTNVVYNRYHHLPLEAQRQKLPVFQYRNHILYLLEKYQTLILIGETGCGKSTQVPQYVHEVGHKVCVTQPRVAACVTLACRVAEERGAALGEDVGYAAAMTSCRTPDTAIVFMTEGVLLREMFASPLLMQYSCIVLDEVHERSQMTDVLMGLLKKIAKKRKNLKIIVSSATMDAEFLKDFFNLGDKNKQTDTSVIMSMQGRTHPIDVFYLEEPAADYVKATVDTVIKIHENQPFGDVLAFLTSQEEILSAMDALQIYAEANNEKNKRRKSFAGGIQAANLSVLPMYGSLPLRRQIEAFQMGDRNTRKVILATNIAETSVTLPGIVYVIDCGFHKLPYFDPVLGVECMCVCPVSRHNAIQRAGRAGRTARGTCYRLYSEAEFDEMAQSVPPEMSRSDLSPVLLQLKALGIHNLLRFSFPSPPPAKSLLSGLETLLALGAVDQAGNLTPTVGSRMAELPLRPMSAKMLCNSGEFGCVEEILSIAAMLQVEGVFLKLSSGKDKRSARVVRRNHFEVAEGDIIMYLNVFESYSKVRDAQADERQKRKACKAWCQKMFINYRVMEKACEIRKSLEKLTKGRFKIESKAFAEPDLGSAKLERVMKCVASGLFPQAAFLAPDGYRGIRGAVLGISPDSCLFHVQQPTWVVFASVQSSGDKILMRELMTINRDWLLEIAPHYYTLT